MSAYVRQQKVLYVQPNETLFSIDFSKTVYWSTNVWIFDKTFKLFMDIFVSIRICLIDDILFSGAGSIQGSGRYLQLDAACQEDS